MSKKLTNKLRFFLIKKIYQRNKFFLFIVIFLKKKNGKSMKLKMFGKQKAKVLRKRFLKWRI